MQLLLPIFPVQTTLIPPSAGVYERDDIINADEISFDFLGFTIRHDVDLFGRTFKYWNIVPSKKSEQKVRDKIRDFMSKHGHSKTKDLTHGLNSILRGWLNYFEIPGVSFPINSKNRLRFYLSVKLYRYYARKSQRKCKLFGQKVFDVLTTKYKLIDPIKYALS